MIINTQWHILKITDYQNSTNLQITVNQFERTVEFSIVNYDGYLQTVTFEANNVRYSDNLLIKISITIIDTACNVDTLSIYWMLKISTLYLLLSDNIKI